MENALAMHTLVVADCGLLNAYLRITYQGGDTRDITLVDVEIYSTRDDAIKQCHVLADDIKPNELSIGALDAIYSLIADRINGKHEQLIRLTQAIDSIKYQTCR